MGSTKRDAEGRPVAEQNAGAFMAPRGMYPVPSSTLDAATRGDQTAYDEAEVERRGRPAPRRPARSGRWHTDLVATAVSLAIWAMCAGAFQLVLLASESAAQRTPLVIGDHMTRLMHEDASWLITNFVFALIAIGLGMRFARRTGMRSRLRVATGTVVGIVMVVALVASATRP